MRNRIKSPAAHNKLETRINFFEADKLCGSDGAFCSSLSPVKFKHPPSQRPVIWMQDLLTRGSCAFFWVRKYTTCFNRESKRKPTYRLVPSQGTNDAKKCHGYHREQHERRIRPIPCPEASVQSTALVVVSVPSCTIKEADSSRCSVSGGLGSEDVG